MLRMYTLKLTVSMLSTYWLVSFTRQEKSGKTTSNSNMPGKKETSKKWFGNGPLGINEVEIRGKQQKQNTMIAMLDVVWNICEGYGVGMREFRQGERGIHILNEENGAHKGQNMNKIRTFQREKSGYKIRTSPKRPRSLSTSLVHMVQDSPKWIQDNCSRHIAETR